MQKVSIKYLLLLLGLVSLTVACNNDEDLDTENPKFVWTQPEFGGMMMFDQDITVSFTDNIDLASASFVVTSDDGTDVATANGSVSGKEGELTWTNDGMTLVKGSYTINATVTDAAGNTNMASNKFTVTEPNASGFESNYVQVFFRGSPVSWGAEPMELVADNTWEIDSIVMNSSATIEFKLANTDNWTDIDWGAAEGTGISQLSGTLSLKEVDAELDDNGEKISETLVRGANENVKLDGTVLDEGDNYYKVIFNDETFDYTVEFQESTGNTGPLYETIGLIGFATTGNDDGWADGADITMYSTDLVNYSIAAFLYTGDVKFRADGAWDNNWGGTDFPAGAAVAGGDNIPVPADSTYYVTFTDGDEPMYTFTEVTSVGLIGSATPEGWDADQDMTRSLENPNMWSITLDLTGGNEIKFRANDAWDINWGGSAGSVVPGGDNIVVAEDGNYTVTFNGATLMYTVTKN
ncbi:MAG: SusF/SusE family outer membrane protein [Bacteroidota bacterium]